MGIPSTSINLGPFSGTGMAGAYASSIAAMGLQPSTTKYLDRIACSCTSPTYAFVQLNAILFHNIMSSRGPWNYLSLTVAIKSEELGAIDSDNVAEVQKSKNSHSLETVEQLVASTISNVGSYSLEESGNFNFEHIDSIGAVEIANALSKAFGEDLPGTVVYDHPSTKAISLYIFSIIDNGSIEVEPNFAAVTSIDSEGIVSLRQLSRLPEQCSTLDSISHVPPSRWLPDQEVGPCI